MQTTGGPHETDVCTHRIGPDDGPHPVQRRRRIRRLVGAVPGGAPAPRRPGKSTFVREDLRPALESRGALVVYADLWADRQADPGEVIVAAVRGVLAKHEGVVMRLAKGAGREKVKVGGLAFPLDKVGLGARFP